MCGQVVVEKKETAHARRQETKKKVSQVGATLRCGLYRIHRDYLCVTRRAGIDKQMTNYASQSRGSVFALVCLRRIRDHACCGVWKGLDRERTVSLWLVRHTRTRVGGGKSLIMYKKNAHDRDGKRNSIRYAGRRPHSLPVMLPLLPLLLRLLHSIP
jgi:hypothetical protein